jgi:hypothetical protein
MYGQHIALLTVPRSGIWTNPEKRSALSRAQFSELFQRNREKYAYSADIFSVSRPSRFVNLETAYPAQANTQPAVCSGTGGCKTILHCGKR